MKKINIAFLVIFIFGSCNKFSDSINTDTNNPNVASNMQLITYAAFSLPDVSSSPQGEYYAQFLSETQYPNLSLYNQANFNFYGWYTGPLMNLQAVIDREKPGEDEWPVNNQMAIAKILKAYFFWHLTDRWGDLPYDDALRGKENFTPGYNTQQEIYDKLFALLKEAADQISGADITGDIVYEGDMEKWKKLANTIRLLMALRLSEVDPDRGADEFNDALNAGIMTSNSDNLVYRHLAEAQNQNYWFDQIANQGRYWWALSETLVEHMKPVEDPRLAVYGDPNTVGEYVGLEYGLTDDLDQQDPSLLGAAIWEQDAPVYLVTYAQALFAKAEAAKRGWIPGGDAEAETNYNLAIEMSVRQWNNNSTAGLAEMMAYPEIEYNPATALEQIATQRWVHLFMHGFEAWAEWRRTGFPALTAPQGKAVPTRQAYPNEEEFNNSANFEEAVQRQFGGTNDLYGKVWWDE